MQLADNDTMTSCAAHLWFIVRAAPLWDSESELSSKFYAADSVEYQVIYY